MSKPNVRATKDSCFRGVQRFSSPMSEPNPSEKKSPTTSFLELIQQLKAMREAQEAEKINAKPPEPTVAKEAPPKKDPWARFPQGESSAKKVVKAIWRLIVQNGAGAYRRRGPSDDTLYLCKRCEVRTHYHVLAGKTDYRLVYWPASSTDISPGLVPHQTMAILRQFGIHDPDDHRPRRLEIGDKQFRPIWFSASRLEPVLRRYIDGYQAGQLRTELLKDRLVARPQ